MVLGETLLTQALREEGIAAIPANDEANQPLWNAVLLKANSPSREDLLTDIGMGRQAAGWVARHSWHCWLAKANAQMPCC